MARSVPRLSTIVKSAYSATKLYVDSTDSKGHYEQLNVKITPTMETLIMQAIDDDQGYSRSRQAFIRDAIVHRLHYLHSNPGSTIDPVVLNREIQVAEMNRIKAADKAVMDQCDLMKEIIDITVENSDWDTLNHRIEEVQAQLESFEYPPGQRIKLQDVVDLAMKSMSEGRVRDRRG